MNKKIRTILQRSHLPGNVCETKLAITYNKAITYKQNSSLDNVIPVFLDSGHGAPQPTTFYCFPMLTPPADSELNQIVSWEQAKY